MTREEYRELRADHSERARAGRGPGLFHWCERCAGCEVAGGYCSACRTAEYVLVAHIHALWYSCPARLGLLPENAILGRYLHPASA